MRHSNKNRILGRTKRQKVALISGLAISLFKNESIKTTEAKAKELRPFVEKLITFGKDDTVASRRMVATRLGEPKDEIIKKLFDIIAPKFQDRNGGYTRIIKVGRTKAGKDAAIIELV